MHDFYFLRSKGKVKTFTICWYDWDESGTNLGRIWDESGTKIGRLVDYLDCPIDFALSLIGRLADWQIGRL
jgi:hypothetical protein